MVSIGKTRASEMQSPKPLSLQRLSYNVYLTTTFSQYLTKRFSHNYFLNVNLTRSFSNVFLTMSFPQRLLFSQRLSNNVFPTTSFSQRFCHNAFTGIILACAMCAMAHTFHIRRIEILTVRRNGARFSRTAHQKFASAPFSVFNKFV